MEVEFFVNDKVKCHFIPLETLRLGLNDIGIISVAQNFAISLFQFLIHFSLK